MQPDNAAGEGFSRCPVTADSYDPMDPAHLANPDQAFRALAEQNPVQFIPAFQMYYVLTEDLCREVLRDHAFRAAMKADPAKALAPLDLGEEERRALLAGDVGALYRMGANAFLMNYLGRFEVCGLNAANYNERMRAVKVDETGQPVG